MNKQVKDEEQNTEILSAEYQDTVNEQANPFLMKGFLEFSIIATLVVIFFPWSLLFSLIFFGMENTKFLILALFHDFLKTLGAIISFLFVVGIILFVIFVAFN